MMELQGAIGIAQLAKLDSMIAAQKSHKARLQAAAANISDVSFRAQVDESGDSATFFAFVLRDSKHRIAIQTVLNEEGVPPICWAENSWHFYPQWEHLMAGSTQANNDWPFFEPGGKKRIVYDPAALPKSAALLERTLVYPVSVKMTEDSLKQMESALLKAASR